MSEPIPLKTTSCVFCSAEANPSHPVTVVKVEEFWPYIQPLSWKDSNAPLQTPPMCPSCSNKIEEIAKCHREIVQLEEKLNSVRRKLEATVKVVPGALQKPTAMAATPRISMMTFKDLESITQNKSLQFVKIMVNPNPAPGNTSGVKRSFDEMMASSETGTENVVEVKDENVASGSNETVTVKVKSSNSITMERIRPSASKKATATVVADVEEIVISSSEDDECKLEDLIDAELKSLEYANSDSEFECKLEKMEGSSSESECDAPSVQSQELKDPLDLDLANSSEDDDDDVDPAPPGTHRNRVKMKRQMHSVRCCVLCGVKISLKHHHKHMKDHVGDFAFQCPSCSVSFPSRLSYSYYRHHMDRCKNNKRSFNCVICGKELRYGFARKHFDKHEIATEKKHHCPVSSCGMSFTCKQSCELHIGSHEIPATKRREKYPRTKLSHDGPSRFIRDCEICGESLPLSTSPLNEHIISHVGDFAFQCPVEECRLTFASRYTQRCKRHRLIKTTDGDERVCKSDTPKICEECNEEFDSQLKLRKHLERHESPKNTKFTCPITNCGKKFTVKQSVEFHLTLHSFRRTLQNCTDCKLKLKLTPDEMEAHFREVHDVQEIFKCGYCPFVFQSQEDLVGHLSSHAKDGVKCHLCSSEEVFFYGGNLKRHYSDKHQIGRRYVCESCNFSAGSLDHLLSHKIKNHGAEGRRQIFVCQICEDKPEFCGAYTLETHNIKLHGGEKLKCNFCEQTFTSRQNRREHEKHEHHGVERRKFPCPKCDRVLNSSMGLRMHLGSVHSTKIHSCSECEKTFKSPNALTRHVKLDHEGAKCVCETCGKSFRGKKTLETHTRIHTGERPYLCKLCGLSFRQQASWYNHNKAHERKGDKFVPKGTFDRTPKTD